MTTHAPEPTVAELQRQLAEMTSQRNLLAQAIADAVVKAGTIRANATLDGPQLLQFVDELADDYLRATQPHQVRRYDVEDGDVEPLPNEPVYAISVERHGTGANILFAPPHTSPEEIEDMPQVSLILEVDGGVPSVYVHGNGGDGCATKIFGLPRGVVGFRAGDTHIETIDIGEDAPDVAKMASEIEAIAQRNAQAAAEAARATRPEGARP